MIHSILHQIWNQRRSNGWLFAELLIVFTLMWYCVDVLYGFVHAERQPKGYDLEHVYKIRISCKFKVVMAFMEQLAENYKQGCYDPRDEWACQLANEAIEHLREKELYYTMF